MFIVSLTYVCELSEIDKYIDAHIEYLNVQYEKGNFLASGRKVPRTGGVILVQVETRAELDEILKEDPFYTAEVATYDVTEFIPTMTAKGFESLKSEIVHDTNC